jgi:hypothetical protein
VHWPGVVMAVGGTAVAFTGVVAFMDGAAFTEGVAFMGAVAFGRMPASAYSLEGPLSLLIITPHTPTVPTITTTRQHTLSKTPHCNNSLTGITAPLPEPTIHMSRSVR